MTSTQGTNSHNANVKSQEPKLLVSVRNAQEAQHALAGGADVVDVKEPELGSLGAASTQTIADVLRVVANQVPVTAALGELVDNSAPKRLPHGLFAAKVGLAGTNNRQERNRFDWRHAWDNLTAGWDTGCVAVAYADYLHCGAPTPVEVASFGGDANCEFVLIDTFSKSDPLTTLLAQTDVADQLDECVQVAKARGMNVVIAGSLRQFDDFSAVVHRWSPNYVAVRGAVCLGERTSSICPQKVSRIKAELGCLSAYKTAN